MSPKSEIFGVKIDSIAFQDAVDTVLGWCKESTKRSRFVVTPNINHLVLYQENASFRNAYKAADLVLPDGRYIVWLSRLLHKPLRETVNGSDLVPAVFAAARSHGALRVYLLGAMPGVAERAAERIRSSWPWVDVVGTNSPTFDFEKSEVERASILNHIRAARPDFLVVGISPPKQEIWVSQCIDELHAKVTVCAGATIDFLAGVKKRAPRWMQRMGLEWVYRVATEPKRLSGRYFRDGKTLIRLTCAEVRAASKRK